MEMHSENSAEVDSTTLFGQKFAEAISDGTFVRLALAPANPLPDAAWKILGRQIALHGTPHLSMTFRYATRDEVKNMPASDAVAWVTARLGGEFKSALLCTTRNDWQLSITEGNPAKLIRHKPSASISPSRDHDQPHRSMLDKTARDWLTGLDVTDASGKVRRSMADKHSQINRYLEVFSHLAKDAGWVGQGTPFKPDEDWTMVDMGCGKGYLTFGLWQLWHRVWGLPGRIIGVDARQDLVEKSNALAESLGASDLRFVRGTINYATLPDARVLIALHACDTATDNAILRGIDMGAELILVAPCCQKELRPQLGRPDPLAPVLRHGIMAERMAEWTTDGLRALFLEWAGYRTKVLEFVSSEHTPKNLMIAAIRNSAPFTDPAAKARVEDLKAFFGVQTHALDPLLLRSPAVS